MKIKIIVAGLVSLLAVATVSAQIKRTTTKTERFDFGSGGTVAIAGAPVGSIRLLAGTKNEIEIVAEITVEAANEADVARLAEVTGFLIDDSRVKASILTIGTHNKGGPKAVWKKFPKKLLTQPFRIDYTVTLPRYTDLEIDGGKGDFSITGIEGALRVNFLESTASLDIVGGSVVAIFGSGTVDVAFGSRGWRGRIADIQVGRGSMNVTLSPSVSAEIDAQVLRTGSIDNSVTDLKPRDRRLAFTDRSISAKLGVGGPSLRFTVGEGTLKLARPSSR